MNELVTTCTIIDDPQKYSADWKEAYSNLILTFYKMWWHSNSRMRVWYCLSGENIKFATNQYVRVPLWKSRSPEQKFHMSLGQRKSEIRHRKESKRNSYTTPVLSAHPAPACDFSHWRKWRYVSEHSASLAMWGADKETHLFFSTPRIMWCAVWLGGGKQLEEQQPGLSEDFKGTWNLIIAL